jgi:hypothetical protein
MVNIAAAQHCCRLHPTPTFEDCRIYCLKKSYGIMVSYHAGICHILLGDAFVKHLWRQMHCLLGLLLCAARSLGTWHLAAAAGLDAAVTDCAFIAGCLPTTMLCVVR